MSFIEMGPNVDVATLGCFQTIHPRGSYLNAYFNLDQTHRGPVPG